MLGSFGFRLWFGFGCRFGVGRRFGFGRRFGVGWRLESVQDGTQGVEAVQAAPAVNGIGTLALSPDPLKRHELPLQSLGQSGNLVWRLRGKKQPFLFNGFEGFGIQHGSLLTWAWVCCAGQHAAKRLGNVGEIGWRAAWTRPAGGA